MPFLGQRQKTFCEESHLGGENRQLPGPRAEHCAFHADEVAYVDILVELKVAFWKLILFCVHLYLALAIGERHESGLAEWTVRQDPPRNTYLCRTMLEFLSGFRRQFIC